MKPLLFGTSRINQKGILEIGQCSTEELVNNYGTPLFVYDTNLIKEQARGFKKTFEERAKNEVTLRLALEQIAKYENITVSDEELEAQIAKLAERYKMTVEIVKQAAPIEEFKSDLLVSKASDFVRSEAKISE